MKRHILILTPTFPNAYNRNAGSYVEDQYKALNDNENLTVRTAILIFITVRSLVKNGLKGHGYKAVGSKYFLYAFAPPFMNRIKQILRVYYGKRLVNKYIKKYGQPDLLHLHSYLMGEVAMWAKKKYDIPYVITEHSSAFIRGMIEPEQEAIINEIFKQSSFNIAVSQGFKECLEKKYEASFHYIPNMVDTDFFSDNHINTSKKNRQYTFLHIANLNKNKNQKALINAFCSQFKGEPVKLLIGGNGPEYQALKRQIEQKQVEDQVELLGILNRKEVRERMQEADCFVLSSLHETFGIVLIEAMSCGLPVVATKCGGPESIVMNSKLGVLCEPSEGAIAEAMRLAFTTQYDADSIRKYAIDKFSNEAVVKRLNTIYETVQ